MIFWIAAALLTAFCIAVLLNTLFRTRGTGNTRAEFDLTVYKDQLSEVERDMDRGLLSDTEAESARLEIERRMLAAAPSGGADSETAAMETTGSGIGAHRLVAGALLAGVPLLAIGLYLLIGSPSLPGIPIAERRALQDEFRNALTGDLQVEIPKLEEHVETRAYDAHAWLLLARAYGELERYLDASNAYRRAIGLGAGEAQIYAALGETLVAAAKGEVGPEARRAFAEAITRDPDNMKAIYYSGLALAQDGRLRHALRIWSSLLDRADPATPWRPLLEERIARLESAIAAQPSQEGEGTGTRTEPGRQSAAGIPGPNAEDIEAASRMSPQDQAAFVRSMVERLAQRLEDQPGDLEGWLRLARAYSVLQERENAERALSRASETFAGQPQEAQAEAAIARTREELGL